MSKPVAISSDSLCDIGPDLKEKYNISYVPYYIILNGKQYKDNIDIFTPDLYKAFRETGVLPKTAANGIDAYEKHFTKLKEQGFDVVHVSAGSGISGAWNNASVAADKMEGVYVVDSCSISSGIGILAINGARMSRSGMSAKDIFETLQNMAHRVRVTFVLSTLDFMVAGGRVPDLAARAMGAIKLKPSIETTPKDGKMKIAKIYRGKIERVWKKMVDDHMNKYKDNISTEEIFVTHSGEITDDQVNIVVDQIKKHKEFKKIYVTQASCTCSTHGGPACLGILFITKN